MLQVLRCKDTLFFMIKSCSFRLRQGFVFFNLQSIFVFFKELFPALRTRYFFVVLAATLPPKPQKNELKQMLRSGLGKSGCFRIFATPQKEGNSHLELFSLQGARQSQSQQNHIHLSFRRNLNNFI
jgi:hypothetical protein